MSTWIYKACSAIFAALLVTGCDQATGLPFASGMNEPAESSGHARMAKVELADGNVILTAPDGYCIDRRTVRRLGRTGFAMLARCDTVGVRGYFNGYDLAIITVTTAAHGKGAPAPTRHDLARAADTSRVLDNHKRDGLALVRLSDKYPPLDGVSPVHWRGAFVLNDHLVSIGLYAPDGSEALGKPGAGIVTDLVSRTRKSSLPRTVANSRTPSPNETESN
ncbi:hypothetical protein [Heliomarina baculiformis]|uniref:hypothetical protein n=1 Tax=Heliomarina baculiformis TaxID=2872036 RepID=UPI001EE1D6B3|nr:hypothetical protein [Heliomarina baculiformis]